MVLKRFILICLSLYPSAALAGMTSWTLTEVAAARLDAISFFLFLFFVCAWLIKWSWNVLTASFPALPRIGYKQALALMLVSSLFLYVILTMISGARELMTPGAWTKVGASYQLTPPERDPKPWLETARIKALEQLRDALWDHAKSHDGQLPPHTEGDQIDRALWVGVHPQGEKFAYRPAAKPGVGDEIVAYEPESYGATRFVLTSDGKVTRWESRKLTGHLKALLDSPPQ